MDPIDRQAAIDAVHKEFDDCIVWDESGMTTANEVERILDSVPSAQQDVTDTNVGDMINRQAAISRAATIPMFGRDIRVVGVSELENLPSAQPEIIRCKDCKFYSPINRETKTGICNLTMHQNFGDNWFCAGAERRTE